MSKPLSKRQQRLAELPPMPVKEGDIPIFYKSSKSVIQQKIATEHELFLKSLEIKLTRRDKIVRATPVWANSLLINSFYTVAQQMTKNTGIQYHVDHIVPLEHSLVCGLHNEFNLQILPSDKNIQKSNKF